MVSIATYVFLDLETTGLPVEETNRTKITELSMVAVKRQHLLLTRAGAAPRVQNKLTICFNPGRMVQPGCTTTTGLCNDLLEHETKFNEDAFNAINSFLNILTKPVCLIAQNGHNFDFPILKNHLVKLSVKFSDDLLCADCYHAFYDILEKVKIPQSWKSVKQENQDKSSEESLTKMDPKQKVGTDEELDNKDHKKSMQEINETTPKHQKIKITGVPRIGELQRLSKVRRRFPWSDGTKPRDSYKLKDIYERVLNLPGIEAHRAENDCIMALQVSVALAKDFVEWVDANHCPFAEVKPMTVGVRLGE
ncbi:unnamed protein product [Parnassius apollo]|uniref:(apollo) hypothetical protein n=1 Tax=Parnassius apollo TaxID=110799 RepID=A0A8S3WBN6_PARAO|nr:unnamed protein product [Parnassius apollo]